MNSLLIRNQVHDYDSCKAAFDKYERFREEHGVRTYRVLRRADDEHDVQVILDFDDEVAALDFRGRPSTSWRPRSPGHRSSITMVRCCSRWSAGSPGDGCSPAGEQNTRQDGRDEASWTLKRPTNGGSS